MPSSTTDRAGDAAVERASGHTTRVARLKAAVASAAPGLCPERAELWTEYFRSRANRRKPGCIGMAEALSFVLARKTVKVYPDELVVGNFSSRRVGGSIYPELHGLPVLLDLFRLESRATNPLELPPGAKRSLLGLVPFWIFRFLALRAHRSPLKKLRLVVDQLKARYYLINEAGGISHFAPDYATLLALGTDGIAARAAALQAATPQGSASRDFYEGVRIACEGLARFGERYAEAARAMAASEPREDRRAELEEIAKVCARVPRRPADGFREALQSLFLAQVALNLESLDNAVSPGRMDQYLYPYYAADIARGSIDREGAKELLACFSIKMSEIVPVFSRHLTNFHGGMFNGQVVTVGGTDREGRDAANELSMIFLEVMDELRMRQPNFHARVHAGSSEEYLGKIYSILASGSNSPALYCDEAIVRTMTARGYSLADARDYTGVGCVEPVCQGKSFSSTDAAIFDLPIVLETALGEGKRLGGTLRTGPRTKRLRDMRSMEDVTAAFEEQLRHRLGRLAEDLRAVEEANRDFHPTPLTSMLIDGCLERGACSTAGGARYNFSGIQCVAPADVGDSLRAIEKAVFEDRRIALPDLARELERGLPDEGLRRYLLGIEKFGNDLPVADRWTAYATEAFARALGRLGKSSRGGDYVMGLYSVTAHEYFGRVVAATPNGRRRGESFGSGIGPAPGMDGSGPTAILNSMNRLDFGLAANGVNFNMKFSPSALRGEAGRRALRSLVGTYFKRGGMQVQVNVLDPSVLIEARLDPASYPGLLVRVSGYSAYFGDLSPAVQDEIIRRSTLDPGARPEARAHPEA
jgi:formate C-acetyltransferase